ncbi:MULTISPECIES: MFS transporter [unclassified Streptomyces]|uniref:MFS transporter n=1 Tax=unclassified Streptomyces TaxID=2593676 RepID=UPI00088C9937|nr:MULTISPECIES: aromatic acid/H+ symport family MFS transporter [unclassified Streptomyces]MDX2732053.1 aromatic acid/H+ symport family MFS transporter [Streptomyces sp. PA03-2a]SCY54803.1 MFS transporter, AAHS family, benzoate transport protein [Streptomyces sp. 136MFCol5.1]
MTTPHTPPERSFRTVGAVMALCWLAVFFDGMDVNIYGAVMPHLLDDSSLGFTASTAGTVGSWTTFGMLIGALTAGTLTDWLGRRPVVVWSVSLFSVGSALCALAPSVTVFGAGRFLAGLGLGGLMPIALAVVTEFAPPRRAALSIGLMMTSYHAGGMVATGLGLALAPDFGWRAVFWAGVLPALIAVPLVLKWLPESPGVLLAKGRTSDAQAVAARYGLPSPTTAEAPEAGARGRFAAVASLFAPGSRIATPLLWVASFAGLLLVYGVSTWLPQLMRASGYSLSSSVTFLMIINAGGIVGMLVAGRAADRFGAVRISAIWFVLTACGTFLLRAHLPLGVAYTVVFITGIWLFSAQAMVYSATSTVYAPAQRATGLGWVTGIGRTGAVVGPWLGGAVVEGGDAGLGFTTFAAAAVLGAAAICLVPLARRSRRGATAQQTSAPAGATE